MVTCIGHETNYIDTLKNLIELDYAASEAYEAAIDCLESLEYRKTFEEFKKDHYRHMKEIADVLAQQGEAPPKAPSDHQWLTHARGMLVNFINDKMVLRAIHSNTLDTNKAYNNAIDHTEKLPSCVPILTRALEDERRHKEWLEAKLQMCS